MNQFLILLVAKSTAILLLGFVIASLLRSAAASARYAVWALTIATIVALPIAMITAPAWRIAVRTSVPVSADPVAVEIPALSSGSASTPAGSQSAAVTQSVESLQASRLEVSPVILLIVWLAGVLFIGCRILIGRYSLRRLARRAAPLTDAAWTSLMRRESQRFGIQREVRVFASDRVSTPLAAGLTSPFILLPHDADSWTREHREIILRHELAHIARGDALVCLLSGIACAIYWINPLVWLASRRLRAEQERSCDDRVLMLGTKATDYAEHLLEVARSARSIGMHSFVSVAMARPSQLEGRLLAVLQNRRRGTLGRSRGIVAAAVALLALSVISAVRPVRAAAIVVASQAAPPVLFETTTRAAKTIVPVASNKPAVAATKQTDSLVTGEVAARSGGTLVLDLKTGASVRIVGVDETRVRMRAILAGRGWRNTLVGIGEGVNGARISTAYRDTRGIRSSSHRMEITVPRRFNVRIESAGGDVFIRGLEGEFTGRTGGGEINIENARGIALLTTGGGPVNVSNSNLSGSVTTGGGAVLIQGVTGGLTGNSGSGSVFYGSDKVQFSEVSSNGIGRTTDGRLFVNKAGGSVTLGDAPNGATVSTGGGEVRIGSAGGDVSVYTGGGDVRIGSASRGAKVTTGGGDVQMTIAGSGGYEVSAQSGNGTVTLTLPHGMNAELDLETAFTNNRRGSTRIESDWPLSTTVTADWDAREGTPRRYVRARQTIGEGGARITVKTVNGDIIIRRR